MLKVALKFGIIGGLLAVLLGVITYVVGFNFVVGSLTGLASLAIYVFIGIYAGREQRKNNDGKITFKNAFFTSFSTLVIAAIISMLFTTLLYHYIDPGFMERQKQAMIEKIENNDNIPREQKDKAIESIDKRVVMTPKKELINFGWGIGIAIVISLIIGASLKKDLNETPEIQ